jgi:hypothetical protein
MYFFMFFFFFPWPALKYKIFVSIGVHRKLFIGILGVFQCSLSLYGGILSVQIAA